LLWRKTIASIYAAFCDETTVPLHYNVKSGMSQFQKLA